MEGWVAFRVFSRISFCFPRSVFLFVDLLLFLFVEMFSSDPFLNDAWAEMLRQDEEFKYDLAMSGTGLRSHPLSHGVSHAFYLSLFIFIRVVDVVHPFHPIATPVMIEPTAHFGHVTSTITGCVFVVFHCVAVH